jgi:hypothetical protein
MPRTKVKILNLDINPLWLLHYLIKSDEYETHLETLLYNIRHKTKSHKYLEIDKLEQMLNYIGFQVDEQGYVNCVMRNPKK